MSRCERCGSRECQCGAEREALEDVGAKLSELSETLADRRDAIALAIFASVYRNDVRDSDATIFHALDRAYRLAEAFIGGKRPVTG